MLNRKYLLISLLSSCLTLQLSAQKTITNYWPRTKVIKEQYQVDPYGARNGFYKEWNQYGTILYNYSWKNDKLHGICTEYTAYQNYETVNCGGKPMVEKYYDEGNQLWEKEYKCADGIYWLYKKVEKNNEGGYNYQTWHSNGKTEDKYMTVAYRGYERRHGYSVSYYKNGKIQEAGNYEYGSKVGHHFKTFDDNDTQSSYWYMSGEIFRGYKKDEYGNISEYIKTNDSFTEQYVRTYSNGILKEATIRRTFPFYYSCSVYEGEEKPQNRLDILRLGGKCGMAANPFNGGDDSYLAIDSIFSDGKFQKVYKNVYLKVPNTGNNSEPEYKVFADTTVEQIGEINQKIKLNNSYYNAMAEAVLAINRLYVKGGVVKKRKIYNAFQEILNEYNYGPQCIITVNIVSGPVKTALYSVGPHKICLYNQTEYDTKYESFLEKDYFKGFRKIITDSLKPKSPVVAHYPVEDINEASAINSGSDLILTSVFSRNNIYGNSYNTDRDEYKVVEVRKPILNDESDRNRIVGELYTIKAAAMKWAQTEDTKELEKQLKDAANTADMKKLLGI
jgi:hypothetical protein